MKTRLISAFVALMIFIPIIILGGNIYTLAVYVLSIIGLKELLDIKESKKKLPDFIKFISYILLTLIIFGNLSNDNFIYSIDIRIVCGLLISFLLPTVLYHDKSRYSVNDALFLIGSLFFLGISFSLLILIRNISINHFIYIILISTMTDTFAYVTGLLIGKNKSSFISFLEITTWKPSKLSSYNISINLLYITNPLITIRGVSKHACPAFISSPIAFKLGRLV